MSRFLIFLEFFESFFFEETRRRIKRERERKRGEEWREKERRGANKSKGGKKKGPDVRFFFQTPPCPFLSLSTSTSTSKKKKKTEKTHSFPPLFDQPSPPPPAPKRSPLRPELRAKLRAVEGDVCRPDCGLSPADLDMVRSRARFVVHCAASISFFEHVHVLLEQNYVATRNAVDLAMRCTALAGYVHVSTAYVNSFLPRGESEVFFFFEFFFFSIFFFLHREKPQPRRKKPKKLTLFAFSLFSSKNKKKQPQASTSRRPSTRW